MEFRKSWNWLRRIFVTAVATAGIILPAPFALGEEVVFSGEFPNQTRESAPALIGAIKSSSSAWPASLVFRYRKSAFQVGRCSATVIGPKTILTAAHCMKNGAEATIQLTAGSTRRVKCTHHPEYINDLSQDFALCLTNQRLSGFRFETINVDASAPALNEKVLLQGFGCRNQQGTDKSFGELFEGESTVMSIGASNQNYIRTNGGAAVCFGDSGGGSFITRNNNAVLFAVNSRGDISDNSYLSTTANPVFLAFLDQWVTDNNAGPICGRGADAQLCRSGR